jgi:UDP-N-acetylglucosamine acyltransferase
LGQDCEVGPFCVIEQDVVMGDRCVLESHAVIRRGVTLGNDNRIFESSVIGGLPQHVQVRTYDGGLRVGNNNVFREYTTLHRSMTPGTATVIGDNCFFMVNAHVAHDCVVGDNVIIANNSMLGGHVTVDDRAFISGGVAVHQFCRVGRQCMVGGTARVVKDVPPYVTIDGVSTFVVGLNTVGLRRGGMTSQDMVQLKAAYRTIYRSGYSWREVLGASCDRVRDRTGRRVSQVFVGHQAGHRRRTPLAAGRHDQAYGHRRSRRYRRRHAPRSKRRLSFRFANHATSHGPTSSRSSGRFVVPCPPCVALRARFDSLGG